MLNACEVKEKGVGHTSLEEIESITLWLLDQQEKDEVSLPCSGLALDVHQQCISLHDLYRMAGVISISGGKPLVSSRLSQTEY